MKTNQEIVQLLTSEFNVNKVWDFIESKPFYNKSYMPMFSTAEEIWKEWSAQDKSLYAKFKWKDKYGGKLHPREKDVIQKRRKMNTLSKVKNPMKTNKEIVALLSDEVNLAAKYGKDYTIAVGSDYARLTINVSDWAAWITDANDDRIFKLMESGKERARVTWRSGSIADLAKLLYSQNDKASGEQQGLKVQDYIKIIEEYQKDKKQAQK
jgi:hypothetical protein